MRRKQVVVFVIHREVIESLPLGAWQFDCGDFPESLAAQANGKTEINERAAQYAMAHLGLHGTAIAPSVLRSFCVTFSQLV